MAFKCDKVDGWAVRFFPHFRFSRIAAQEEEFFYPIDVETGLLLHRAAAADTGANSTHDRGTAIFHWSPNDVEWEGDLAVPNPGIGDARFAGRPDPAGDFGDWFLNFGGWCEATTRLTGQNVYTWDLFKSGVYDQLGLPNSQEPTDVDNCEDTADLATPQQFQPDAIIDPFDQDLAACVREATHGLGASIVVCANPVAATQTQAVEIVRKGGRVVLFGGLPKAEPMVSLNANRIHYGEIQVVGAFSYHPSFHELALDLLSRHALPADLLITHTFSLERIAEAFEAAVSGSALKVIVEP